MPRREPKPAVEAPERPAWLRPYAVEAWNRLAPELLAMGVLTRVDGMALVLLCEAWADWRECRDALEEHGRTYQCRAKSGDLMTRSRPEVAMAADAWRRTSAALAEFGCTPSSRSRVSGAPPEIDPLDEFLKR